eukprot:364437-Chlamydomonas_euryale.AAC.8
MLVTKARVTGPSKRYESTRAQFHTCVRVASAAKDGVVACDGPLAPVDAVAAVADVVAVRVVLPVGALQQFLLFCLHMVAWFGLGVGLGVLYMAAVCEQRLAAMV